MYTVSNTFFVIITNFCHIVYRHTIQIRTHLILRLISEPKYAPFFNLRPLLRSHAKSINAYSKYNHYKWSINQLQCNYENHD